ncbi:MAG: S41 family peptidase [Candidatus Omnitrophota bacterium]
MKTQTRVFKFLFLLGVFTIFLLNNPLQKYSAGVSTARAVFAEEETKTAPVSANPHQAYLDFFERVYDMMDKNYYRPVSRQVFDQFVEKFDSAIYAKLAASGKSSDFIRWRSAAFLVENLKSPEDTFSAFFPPKPAKDFEQKVLGERVDLGIEGKAAAEGYIVSRVEPRSDAYLKGLRENDIIFKIAGLDIRTLSEEKINELLNPLMDTLVSLQYKEYATKQEKTVDVLSQEYYKQSVFMVPVDVPGIFCLEIRTFNRKTSEDMLLFLSSIEQQGSLGLILDLRGNPGGPPLAAGEIAGFFLPGGPEIAYFQRKDNPTGMLTAADLPEKYHYKEPIVILVNKESGSASELFSGVLQKFGRAILMGDYTAGKVLLKSMFHFDDESMVLLVTARGHFYDGSEFSFDGLKPDVLTAENDADLARSAAHFLFQKSRLSKEKGQ